jgi:hypothetical protein
MGDGAGLNAGADREVGCGCHSVVCGWLCKSTG